MPTRRKRSSHNVALQSAELAVAVPQVIAHRVTRMAMAGPVLSERDRREFQNMVAEKQVAFTQAWLAMATEAFQANQAIATSMYSGLFQPFLRMQLPAVKIAADMQNAAMGVLGKGLTPVHRKAVSNAKRLAKTKLR